MTNFDEHDPAFELSQETIEEFLRADRRRRRRREAFFLGAVLGVILFPIAYVLFEILQ